MFLEPTDKDAFLDFPLKEKPVYKHMEHYVACPKCLGHGGWNYIINAYRLWDKEDTAENRHKHAHFRASCGQCNGWGWTDPDNTKCLHEYKWDRNTGRCLNVHKCTKCGKEVEYDSSD
jgi:hypothetical protein